VRNYKVVPETKCGVLFILGPRKNGIDNRVKKMTNPILPPAMSLVSYLAWGTCAILAFAFYQFLLIVRPATKKGFQPIPSPPEASLISGHTTLWKRVGVRPDQTAVVQWAREYGEIFQIRTGICKKL